MKYIAGHVQVTPQMYREIQRDKCQEASDTRYAVTSERSKCVCGQHENPVPLAPLFYCEPDDPYYVGD